MPHIQVTAVGLNVGRIALSNDNDRENAQVYEPGLSEVVAEVREGYLFFSTEVDKAIDESE